MALSRILIRTIPLALVMVIIKVFLLPIFQVNGADLSALVEISDLSVVFTGAFFVMALMLTGTMTDFKESEKIPGEISANFEAIQDWSILGFKAPRTGTSDLSKEPLDKAYVHQTISEVTYGVIQWFRTAKKDSRVVFPLLRRLNGIAYYFAERGVDKEAIKGIQENTNAMRKQISRAYAISRTSFLSSAYVLLNAILTFVLALLLITKFKTPSAEYMATFILAFIFIYLYHLIIDLDDPFSTIEGSTDVELRPLEKFHSRLGDDFLKY
jgi:hypothetical protein